MNCGANLFRRLRTTHPYLFSYGANVNSRYGYLCDQYNHYSTSLRCRSNWKNESFSRIKNYVTSLVFPENPHWATDCIYIKQHNQWVKVIAIKHAVRMARQDLEVKANDYKFHKRKPLLDNFRSSALGKSLNTTYLLHLKHPPYIHKIIFKAKNRNVVHERCSYWIVSPLRPLVWWVRRPVEVWIQWYLT